MLIDFIRKFKSVLVVQFLILLVFLLIFCLYKYLFLSYPVDNNSLSQRTSYSLNDKNSLKNNNSDNSKSQNIANKIADSNEQIINVVVEKGQSLISIIKKYNVSKSDILALTRAIKKKYDPHNIKKGDIITLYLKLSVDYIKENIELVRFTLKPKDSIQFIDVEKNYKLNKFIAIKRDKNLHTTFATAEFDIQNNLYEDAARANIPISVIMRVTNMFSHVIDFQRDIRIGDKVYVLYEKIVDEKQNMIDVGRVLFSAIETTNSIKKLYLYQMKSGKEGYFSSRGTSYKKSLLLTPIDGARISSSFGWRKHPILGYSKMHTGIDFAAITGTPIFAAGDGVIILRRYYGAFGNTVKIRHQRGVVTLYAHMVRFRKGHKRGTKVKQGEIIGYVGSTGRSTGPHLHYETHKNGRKVNPKTLISSSNDILVLKGEDMRGFREVVNRVDLMVRYGK